MSCRAGSRIECIRLGAVIHNLDLFLFIWIHSVRLVRSFVDAQFSLIRPLMMMPHSSLIHPPSSFLLLTIPP